MGEQFLEEPLTKLSCLRGEDDTRDGSKELHAVVPEAVNESSVDGGSADGLRQTRLPSLNLIRRPQAFFRAQAFTRI